MRLWGYPTFFFSSRKEHAQTRRIKSFQPVISYDRARL
jgi:hypothetical protein